MGGEGDYIPIATLSPPESVTSALTEMGSDCESRSLLCFGRK